MSELRVYGPLEIGTPAQLDAPAGARVVAFSAQGGQYPYLWAEIDRDAPPRPLRYIVVGTGHAIPTHARRARSWASGGFVLYVSPAARQSEKVTP